MTGAGDDSSPKTSQSRSEFTHPETGELLSTQADFHAALREIEERMAPLYRIRRAIRDERSERFEAVLPDARSRTSVQDRVVRCPRCNSRLDE